MAETNLRFQDNGSKATIWTPVDASMPAVETLDMRSDA